MASKTNDWRPSQPRAAVPQPWELPKTVKIILTSSLTLLLMLICYTTPVRPELMPLHNIHQHLFYIPIVLAAYWHGVRGGMISAILIFLLYVPHVSGGAHGFHHRMTDWTNWSDINHFLEGGTYLLIGFMTGYLTDRLRAGQRRIEAANDDLERQSEARRRAMEELTARTREVFEAEEQLRRADRLAALGQLTTGLAHEIRNPLGSIRGAAEILGDADAPPPRRAEFSRILIDETERLDEVLRNFLEYARSQRAEAPASCELASVVDRLLALLGNKIEKAGIAVERILPAPLPPAAVPETLLQQALLNLLLNAVQAMPEGGRLRIEAAHDPDRRRLTILIQDTGPGVPPQNAGRIFDPFFTTKSGGTGLGLSIVHKIAVSQGGRVWLDAGGPAGCRFALDLPSV